MTDRDTDSDEREVLSKESVAPSRSSVTEASDPIPVRFPCPDHPRQLFKHLADPRAPGRPVWCDGGETRLLRKEHDQQRVRDRDVWVEVKAP